MLLLLIMMLALAISTKASLLNFLEVGALPNDLSDIAAWHNGRLLNETLALLQPGDLFNDYELMMAMMMAAWHNGRLLRDTLAMLLKTWRAFALFHIVLTGNKKDLEKL